MMGVDERNERKNVTITKKKKKKKSEGGRKETKNKSKIIYV